MQISPEPVAPASLPVPIPAQRPVIHIFVRHSKDCAYAGEETYKRCNCWKWVRWRQSGKLNRKKTRSRTWAGAERFKHTIEDSFDAPHAPAPHTPITVEQAIEMFKIKKSDMAPTTMSKYRQTLDRLLDFCNREGRIYVYGVTESDILKFKASFAADAAYTRRNHQERLRAFFRYCCSSSQIRLAFNPTAQLEAVDLSAQVMESPYTPQQYSLILSTIPKVEFTQRKQLETHLQVRVMREAGLAIQDAVTLERAQVHKAKVNGKTCYRIVQPRGKSNVPVNNPITLELGEALLKFAEGNSNKQYIFWSGNGTKKSAVTGPDKRLRKVFNATGIPNAHSHRFRDTFVVTLLEAGVPVPDVARAAGNTVTVMLKHYGKWTQPQQNRLDDYVASTWTKKKKARSQR
jgi:site-specific recombinase XerD